jgi:hypothetical protein
MKKQVLVLLALFGTLSTYAQVTFGVKAGFNSASLSIDADGEDAGTSRLSAWHAGGIADISLAENFSLQPQLLVSVKGYKTKGYSETIEVPGADPIVFEQPSAKTSFTYLEVPVNFLYKLEAGAGKIFFGAGPYVGFGLTGKVKVDAEGAEDGDVKFDGKKAEELEEGDEAAIHVKRLDAGANFLAGYELKNGLLFSVNYGLGLTNLDPNGNKSKNGVIGISVGYLFGKKK